MPGPFESSTCMADEPLHYDSETHRATVRDSVRIVCEGRVVGTVHASYDLSEVPEEFIDDALHILTLRPRYTLGAMSQRQVDQTVRYYNARNVWKAIPWWKRWLIPEPQYENFA